MNVPVLEERIKYNYKKKDCSVPLAYRFLHVCMRRCRWPVQARYNRSKRYRHRLSRAPMIYSKKKYILPKSSNLRLTSASISFGKLLTTFCSSMEAAWKLPMRPSFPSFLMPYERTATSTTAADSTVTTAKSCFLLNRGDAVVVIAGGDEGGNHSTARPRSRSGVNDKYCFILLVFCFYFCKRRSFQVNDHKTGGREGEKAPNQWTPCGTYRPVPEKELCHFRTCLPVSKRTGVVRPIRAPASRAFSLCILPIDQNSPH